MDVTTMLGLVLLGVAAWLLLGAAFVTGCWWAGHHRPTADEAMRLHEELALERALRSCDATARLDAEATAELVGIKCLALSDEVARLRGQAQEPHRPAHGGLADAYTPRSYA